MTFRFRRTIRLAPGVRLNVGKRGFSLSVGPRGASVTVGGAGTFLNAGLPGTGLSVRQKLDESRTRRHSRSTNESESAGSDFSVITRLNEDGTVDFLDASENPLPDDMASIVKRQKGEQIRTWLSEQCDKINNKLAELERVHLETPHPKQKPVHTPTPFSLPEPTPPVPKKLGILGRLFKKARSQIEADNAAAQRVYAERRQEWLSERDAHIEADRQRRHLVEQRLYSDPEAMYTVLEEALQAINWPRETNVSFEIDQMGKSVISDVDLPEIEDMPAQSASLPARGLKLTIRELTDTKLRQIYMKHVHGVGFRLIGVIFATLPSINEVTISGYSQRANKTTGNIEDEYLYSARVSREIWSDINFHNLEALDVVSAFNNFELRRKMTKTGVFTSIIPFTISDHIDAAPSA